VIHRLVADGVVLLAIAAVAVVFYFLYRNER
jgi:hypothetical protein